METDKVAGIRVAIREEYEGAKNYSNVILGVGYAGFFGLWAITKDYDYPRAHAVAALSIGLSLIIFVFWEIYQTGAKGNLIRRFAKALALGNLTPETYQLEQAQLAHRLSRNWMFIFYPCVFFGIAGAGTLLAVLMLRAFKNLT